MCSKGSELFLSLMTRGIVMAYTLKTFKVTGKDKGHPITGHELQEGGEKV